MLSVSKYINKPSLIVQSILRRLTFIPDALYLKWMYRFKMGKKLNLSNPTTFNEKLQWLKLNFRKDEMTTLVDKAAVKEYLRDRIDSGYIIPTIAIYDTVEEIDWQSLPNKFVVKTTNGGGEY